MNKFIILLFLSLIFITGCGNNKNNSVSKTNFQLVIAKLVENAVGGDLAANDSLSGLIDYSLPFNSSYNRLSVENMRNTVGKTIYTVLLEYPNPIYNRFAIYDSALTPLIIDKSLNGRLSLKLQNFNDKSFIEINEVFISRDIVELNRLSLYSIDETVHLVFRIYTKMVGPKNIYYQTISEFNSGRIRTDISSEKPSALRGKSEVFAYDYTALIYNSTTDIFGDFVKSELSKQTKDADKPEIHDEKSALQSVGITVDADTIKNASNVNSKAGYYLTLTEGWKELKNVVIAGYSKTPLKGSRYENTLLGARIFVINLNKMPAESYFNQNLVFEKGGKAKVRYSDKVESKKYYLQYFEYSCGTEKYILIFEASKYTYEQYKKEYEDIINSFSMDCK